MSRRAQSVTKRLGVAVVAALLAWLFGWTSNAGLLMVAIAVAALALAIMRGWFGGLRVLWAWVRHYRHSNITLPYLGDIVGEHDDDMLAAGLSVPQPLRQRSWRGKVLARPMPRPPAVPKMQHHPYAEGIIVRLVAVRAGMSQEEILTALPRLRSAWGVDLLAGRALPGGRIVEFTIPTTDRGIRELRWAQEDAQAQAQATSGSDSAATRPPDAPPAQVIQGNDQALALSVSGELPVRPPRYQPQVLPDEYQAYQEYEVAALPVDAARTFAPRPLEREERVLAGVQEPSTDEFPVVEQASPVHRPPSPAGPARSPGPDFGDRAIPTDVSEKSTRLGAQWRTGSHR